MDETKKLFSIVVPIYGNEKNIPITIPYFVDNLSLFPNYRVEIIMVCDGSPDNSFEEMKKMQKTYPGIVRIASFTRNFGQGAAIHCGMDMARGDVIGVISCDMQDPFELFAEMLAAWEEGYKLVIAARSNRKEHGVSVLGSKILHNLIHRFVDHRYPVGGFDFFLVDREVSEQFRNIDAANGALQMALIWLGYKYKCFPYVRKERKEGKSGYKFWRKLTIVFGYFTTYSPIISQFWGFCGIGLGVVGLTGIIASLIAFLIGHSIFNWMLISVILLCTGAILGAIASIGEYVWRTFDNTKHRPRYVVESKYE